MAKRSFSRDLLRWYRRSARELPWRTTKDPYKIWISEIMLQQTTVAAVIPYYNRWIKRFPTIHHVARAHEQTILKFWQGLGYYSRARNIKKTAKGICQDFQGHLPRDPVLLKSLPGFGPYTVGAVASIAFDIRHPIIDANVRRVVMRVLAIEGKADSKIDRKVYSYLDTILPKKNVGDFNQALMELGALICKKNNPLCSACPVRNFCEAYRKGIQELIPKSVSKVIKNQEAAIAVIKDKNKILIQKRPDKGLFAGLWEFPGGKLKKEEGVRQALKRKVIEELGAEVKNIKFLLNVTHYYTQFKVRLHVFTCALESNSYPTSPLQHKWVSIPQLSNYPMPSGSAKIVEKLSSGGFS